MKPDAEPPSQPVSRRFAGYDLTSRVALHRGTATYRAIQVTLRRPVLVTVLPPAAGKIQVQREHFHRQQDVASRLHHENVVSTIDAGTHKGCRYFVTEAVEGGSFADEIKRTGPCEIGRAISVVRDVARAIAYIDGQGLVHRNVSPNTVLVSDAGVVKLSGFTLAKDKRPGGHETWIDHDVDATLFVAPEFLNGEKGLDVRADIYSLGCVLYHALTGHAPFQSRSAAVVLESHAMRVPTDPREIRADIPDGLVLVLDRCLRKKREHRFAKAEDLGKDLDAVRAGQPVSKMSADGALWVTPGTLLPRLRKKR